MKVGGVQFGHKTVSSVLVCVLEEVLIMKPKKVAKKKKTFPNRTYHIGS